MSDELGDDCGEDFMVDLAELRTYDVSVRRSNQLRRRCHATLRAEPPPKRLSWMADGSFFRRVIVPALGAAWCLVYLVEIIRRVSSVYDLPH